MLRRTKQNTWKVLHRQTAENAASYGDSHSLYATMKTLSGYFGKTRGTREEQRRETNPRETETIGKMGRTFRRTFEHANSNNST